MILNSILVLGGSGLIFGFILAIAAKQFAVHVDPRQEMIQKILPGANCGACGFPGCNGYAEALVKEGVDPGLCTVGGEETAKKIGELLGKEVSMKEREVARVKCGGSESEIKFDYNGIKKCSAANMVSGGYRACEYACLGYGDCVRVCQFDAIDWEKGKVPEIIPEKCTACGKCIEACPVKVIELIPAKAKVYVKCSSHDRGPGVRKLCKVGCFACKICVKACTKGAITMEDNLATINYNLCDGCGACVKKCPTKTIVFTMKAEKEEAPALQEIPALKEEK